MKKRMHRRSIVKHVIAVILMVLIVGFWGVQPAFAREELPSGGLKNQVICQEYNSLQELQEETGEISVGKIKKADTYWDKFAYRYFYSNMNSAEKALYNNLNSVCYSVLTTGITLTEDGDGVFTPGASYEGLSTEQAQTVALVFAYENPQYYFLDGKYKVLYLETSGNVFLGVYDEYQDGMTRADYTSTFKSKVNGYLAQINEKSSILEKEQKAHDIILDIVTYDDSTEENTYKGQSCASVFFTGRSVCAGYAEAFALLCNGAGIPTISVTSAEHEWNQVYIDGNWYAVDAIWNDTCGQPKRYYNVSDAFLMSGNSMHYLESFWETYKRPVCKYNYGEAPSKQYIYNGVNYTAVFEPDYYASNHPDVKNAYGLDTSKLLEHFVNHGMSEGRRGNSKFDVKSYKNRYADLREVYGNNLKSYYMHYINFGEKEGRSATNCPNVIGAITIYNGVNYAAVYDYNNYIAYNPDVKRAYGNDDIATLAHFVNNGMNEGRIAKNSFNVISYKNRYPDLRNAYGTNLKSYYMHYISYGKNERREATGYQNMIVGAKTVYQGVDYNAVYDFNTYVKNNRDVLNAFGYDENKVLAHFVNNGMNEGRIAKDSFNVQIYKARYSDLQQAFGDNLKNYYLHYNSYGIKEGRTAL